MRLLAAFALVSLLSTPVALACDGEKTSSAPTYLAKEDPSLASASFKVDGMSCGVSCPVAIKTALTGLTGVSEVAVNFETKMVDVRYIASEVTTSQMVEAITKLGYKAESVQPQPAKPAATDTKKASS